MVALALVAACGEDGGISGPPVVAWVEITPAADTLIAIGEKILFRAVAKEASGRSVSDVGFLWNSSNPAVATVNPNGVATAREPGETTITASVDGVSDSALLVVHQVVFTIALTPAADTLFGTGDSLQFNVLARDARWHPVWDAKLVWSSSNPGVATVDTTGLATAVGFGETTIRVAANGITEEALLTVTAFATLTGHLQTCGVTIDGTAYCWGRNDYGQLGDGTMTDRTIPVRVSGGLSFASLTAGFRLTCGITTDATAYCWGWPWGAGTQITTPVPVSGGLSFASLSAGGGEHTCGVTTDAAAYCWGGNPYGLGDGTIGATYPRRISEGVSFASVSVGRYHTCGVTTQGLAYCWGCNFNGQLGDGTTTDRTSPVPVSGGLSPASLGVGCYHTCGLATDGAAYCWGYNFTGQLGDGTTTDRTSPVPVSGGLSFASLGVGCYHTCGLATDGAAYCWGNGASGQLGDGRLTDSTIPVQVSGGLSFASLTAGYHTCGVADDGGAYCWGDNSNGQLGNGSLVSQSTPGRVVSNAP